MKTLTILLICSVFAGVFNSVQADEGKKKSSNPKIAANYRQSNARKATTIKNPDAIKSQRQVADKETTAAFNAFRKNCTTLTKSKDYSGIQSAVDEFLSSQSKLTNDMKSMAISYKVSAYMAEKEYQQAIDTAREAMKLKSTNSARHPFASSPRRGAITISGAMRWSKLITDDIFAFASNFLPYTMLV